MEKAGNIADEFLIGCLRRKEDHRNTIGWKGGDCLTCVPDYIAEKLYKDFIPNSKCGEYILCRYFWVVAS
jgi:hypothetical protein